MRRRASPGVFGRLAASLFALSGAFGSGLLMGFRWGREDGRAEMARLAERLMAIHGTATARRPQ